MPGLRELLKKRDKIAQDTEHATPYVVPDFKFIRTTTESEEIIHPPTFKDDANDDKKLKVKEKEKRRTLGFRHSSNSSITKDPTAAISTDEKGTYSQPLKSPREEKRFSSLLHLGHRHRPQSSSGETSENIPDYLPAAPEVLTVSAPPPNTNITPKNPSPTPSPEQKRATEHREAQWEKRATMLAMTNPLLDLSTTSDPINPTTAPSIGQAQTHDRPASQPRSRSSSPSSASSPATDATLQQAIHLHETGDLTTSTTILSRLANPTSTPQPSALAQVLYGLALRHGWGVPADPARAIHYLALAASTAASIEERALAAGSVRGGEAKGELVLAVFELGNCFRNGWGTKRDAVAARCYYEAAANLGDTDAMEEAAWCWLEGFGGSKDKFKAAQYLRLAEQKGSKGVGNSWIWKEKYNPK